MEYIGESAPGNGAGGECFARDPRTGQNGCQELLALGEPSTSYGT